MMQNNDLISRKALIESLMELEVVGGHKMYRQGCDHTLHGLVPEMINAQPAVDAAPVAHGHWFLIEPEYLNCSVCGKPYYTGIETLSAALDHLEYAGGHKFCPNCGAKMDRKDDT